MVDVTHDRDDRRARLELFRRVIGGWRGLEIGGVFFLLHCLEAEFAGDQFDLVEVEPLIDGDHQPEVLEREPDDLYGRGLQDLRELADGDELVDTNRLLLALHLGGLLGGKLLTIAAILGAARSAATNWPAHRRHRFSDVRRHRFLIDSALPLLSATPPTIFAATSAAIVAARRCGACTRRRRCDRTRRRVRRPRRYGTRTRSARNYWLRT